MVWSNVCRLRCQQDTKKSRLLVSGPYVPGAFRGSEAVRVHVTTLTYHQCEGSTRGTQTTTGAWRSSDCLWLCGSWDHRKNYICSMMQLLGRVEQEWGCVHKQEEVSTGTVRQYHQGPSRFRECSLGAILEMGCMALAKMNAGVQF